MSRSNHILAIRFSALGDVAMTVPVLRLATIQHPQLKITMLSEPWMQPLFEEIERVEFIGASTKKEFKGLQGLYRLSKLVRHTAAFDAIADLHNVLRTQVLRSLLWKSQTKLIDKGRAEKKMLTRPHGKVLKPLPSGFQRYADVFARLGYPIQLNISEGLSKKTLQYNWLPNYQPEQILIGVAPFARHLAKMYPLSRMKEVVQQLCAQKNIRVVLLGSAAEAEQMIEWEKQMEGVILMAGKLSFSQELKMISSLNLMISMDSANMHLASLFGVPVVSVWGGTHPFLGFYGWGQDPNNAIQDDLPCRPSSVFGNKPCPVHGDAGCMQGISADRIIGKCLEVLNSGR